MFVGRHVRQLDRKGRMAIPAEFLGRMAPEDRGEIYVTPGVDGCIWLLPRGYYDEMASQLAGSEDDVLDQFYHYSQLRSIDKAGRILLDDDARAFAEIADPAGEIRAAVIVCGSGKYMQVWEKEDYSSRAPSPRDFAKRIKVIRRAAEAAGR